MAIRKATQYLRTLLGQDRPVRPHVLMLAHHLVKRYGVDLGLRPAQLVERLKRQLGRGRGVELFLRLVAPSYVLEPRLYELQTQPKTIDSMLIAALYCDQQTTTPRLFRKYFTRRSPKGYRLTHIFFADRLLAENHCAIRGEWGRWAAQHLASLQHLIESALGRDPAAIHGLAMMFYDGHRALVKPSWMRRLVRAQQGDGSWHHSAHATVFALWALLQSEHPSAAQRGLLTP